jgi:hypothetical protein
MPQAGAEDDCAMQVMVPRVAQYLLAAEQEEGTGTLLHDKSPAKKVLEGIIAHFDTGSTPKGAKYAGPVGGAEGHMSGMAWRLSCWRVHDEGGLPDTQGEKAGS